MTTGADPVGEAIADWASRTASDEAPAPVRAVSAGAIVELREITDATVREICRLQVAPHQRGHVAPNAVSLAEALFEPKAWYRAIVADDVSVGFVMLYDDPDKPEYFLWRLMVGAPYQGLGIGRSAVGLLVEHVRTRPAATELRTSWVPGPDGPERFYLALGFEATGEVDEGEIVARLAL